MCLRYLECLCSALSNISQVVVIGNWHWLPAAGWVGSRLGKSGSVAIRSTSWLLLIGFNLSVALDRVETAISPFLKFVDPRTTYTQIGCWLSSWLGRHMILGGLVVIPFGRFSSWPRHFSAAFVLGFRRYLTSLVFWLVLVDLLCLIFPLAWSYFCTYSRFIFPLALAFHFDSLWSLTCLVFDLLRVSTSLVFRLSSPWHIDLFSHVLNSLRLFLSSQTSSFGHELTDAFRGTAIVETGTI